MVAGWFGREGVQSSLQASASTPNLRSEADVAGSPGTAAQPRARLSCFFILLGLEHMGSLPPPSPCMSVVHGGFRV